MWAGLFARALLAGNVTAAPPATLATVEQRVAQFGPSVRNRVAPAFLSVGLEYPPRELALLAFKDSRHLQLYARASSSDSWRFVKDYRIEGASGTLGPKLGEGDRQVPEGIYRVNALNPNSRHYLSLRINFPNEFDRALAERDGRSNLGGDIMIHGGRGSTGCLAMGNPAIEELFVLAAQADFGRVRVVISPTDFRIPTARVPGIVEPWLRDLYLEIRSELQQYRRLSPAGS